MALRLAFVDALGRLFAPGLFHSCTSFRLLLGCCRMVLGNSWAAFLAVFGQLLAAGSARKSVSNQLHSLLRLSLIP